MVIKVKKQERKVLHKNNSKIDIKGSVGRKIN